MSNYSNDNKINVTTSMMTIWDSISGNQLKVSLFNNGISIAIWVPFVDPSTGTRKYPAEMRHSVMLTPKSVEIVEGIIKQLLIPAYDKGENAKSGVFTNNNNTSMIELEVNNGEFAVIIHRNIDPSTRIPKNTVRFKFDSVPVVEKYESTTGELEISTIQADFFVFSKAICSFNYLAGGMYSAHGTNLANSIMNTRFMDYIRAIADAVHAQLPAPTSYGYQNRNYNPNGVTSNMDANNATASQNVPDVATVEVTTLNDLIN